MFFAAASSQTQPTLYHFMPATKQQNTAPTPEHAPKHRDLLTLLADVRACRLCADKLEHPPRPVIQASPVARICVAGQAPGTKVHASGLPFDDRSGDRLRTWMGIDRATFYDPRKVATIPMGFCFPGQDAKGGDLPPRRECAATWHDRVFAALPQFELILLVGGYAQKWHLNRGRTGAQKTLTDTVNNWRAYTPLYVPLPHPSWRNTGWLKKNPWFETDVVPYIQQRIHGILETKAAQP